MRRGFAVAGVAVMVVLAAGAALVWKPAIPPIDPPPAGGFAAATIAHGAELAAIGDCAVCHTAHDGIPYAGGRPLPTPFGTIYVTNITPDPGTGIGRWSEAAFARAMRDGVGREGRFLYPALPYPHFTAITDPDMAALYAFLMTRAPVHASTPPNALPFPLNLRVLLAGWNLLFLHHGRFQPDPAQDPVWNRGAYLVETLGHCGACHTPHNPLGAERNAHSLAGGQAEGWDAPPLQAASSAGAAWTVSALSEYLRTGFTAAHGAAAGPMTEVTQALGKVSENDLHAIAVYILSRMPLAPPEPVAPKPVEADGSAVAAVFAGSCGNCHGADAPMTRNGAPSLQLSTAVNAADPRDVIQVILHGLPWREGTPQPYMPSFAASLSDAQVADLVRYLRAHYARGSAAWDNADISTEINTARQQGGS